MESEWLRRDLQVPLGIDVSGFSELAHRGMAGEGDPEAVSGSEQTRHGLP